MSGERIGNMAYNSVDEKERETERKNKKEIW